VVFLDEVLRMIKAIVFDYGGVVGTDVMNFIHERVARKVGLPFENVKAEFKKLSPAIQKGEMSASMFYLRLGKVLNIDPNELEKIWTATFEENARVNKEVVEIVRLLKNGGYKIALCTNNISPFVKMHNKHMDFSIFPVQIVSCEIGMRKPEKEIYEYTLKQLNVKADECIFIDDKPANIEAAKNIGMVGILFENARQLKEELRKCGVHGL
jgi:epoxide hydrolase-like predicted phosphatase